MDKTILLKIQLAEAAMFARSKTTGHKRLAIILLDNFIEIQLSGLIKMKFNWDDTRVRDKKYSHDIRKDILMNHDSLLKACAKEEIISTQEIKLIAFCHRVRNNHYHKGSEDALLTEVSLIILHDLIVKYQPKWQSARYFLTIGTNDPITDPYPISRKSKSLDFMGQTEYWEIFLKDYFVFIDKRKKGVGRLLSAYLVSKLNRANSCFKFILENNYSGFFPHAKNWDYNIFLLHYSFLENNKDFIEKIEEMKDRKKAQEAYNILLKNYQSKWRNRNIKELKSLLIRAERIAKLDKDKALLHYSTIYKDVLLIYNALTDAVADLEGAIQSEVDYLRGK